MAKGGESQTAAMRAEIQRQGYTATAGRVQAGVTALRRRGGSVTNAQLVREFGRTGSFG